MDENPPLGGFLAKLSVSSDREESVWVCTLENAVYQKVSGISTECPCVTIFMTNDFVGHWEEVACDFAMHHAFVVSVHASACVYVCVVCKCAKLTKSILMVVGPLVLSLMNTFCTAVFMCTCAYMEGEGLGLNMQGSMTYIDNLCGGGGGGGGRGGTAWDRG